MRRRTLHATTDAIPARQLAWELSTQRQSVHSMKRETGFMLAIGMVETRGLIGLVAATDAMAKAANVKVMKRIDIGGGFVTVVVNGDVGSVRAAVEADAHVAGQVGELVSKYVIANPAEGVIEAFLV